MQSDDRPPGMLGVGWAVQVLALLAFAVAGAWLGRGAAGATGWAVGALLLAAALAVGAWLPRWCARRPGGPALPPPPSRDQGGTPAASAADRPLGAEPAPGGPVVLPAAAGQHPAGAAAAASDTVQPSEALLEQLQRCRRELDAVRADVDRRVAERTEGLLREKQVAEAAAAAKSRFLANMSHELRTPLHGVIGSAQLLQEGGQGRVEREELIDAIRSSGSNLLGLIENILDLSRIESGAFGLAPVDFNLVECLEGATGHAAVAARVKGLELALIVDPRLPAWRHGDALRLRQVLLNLLTNAVKFTPQGEVTVRVRAGAAADAVRIDITDTGVGIAAEALPVIFEPFRQGDDGATRRYGGSGLGLAIARLLVEAMGGRIGVRSNAGRGAHFHLELPLPPAHDPVAEPAPLRHKVVCFEPHAASAEALAAQLLRLGCVSVRCGSAEELRAWLAEHVADPDPPWLLAAIDAPETSAVLEASLGWLDPQRIIGMTRSESHEADLARERLGMPRTVVKPVLRTALVSRLGAVSRASNVFPHEPRQPAAPPEPQSFNAKHVLVVEDDRLNQTIVCSMLHNAGYVTTSADDGLQAIELLSRQIFDLVLMDWQMPEIDGLEVTRRLRQGAAGRFGTVVPIVALTANAFAEDRAACLDAGMNDYLTKPVLAADLIATVSRWTAVPGGDDNASAHSAFMALY